MRTSQYLLSTLKEIPSDAEIISHQLMLRSGMIRKLASGLYTWLPTGLRVLKNIENIIREEMNNANVLEISMPFIQPADLWKKSGRLINYGKELLRFIDRNNRQFVLGSTHEEVISDLMRNEIYSYTQLPLSFFQITTKFRDEMRPRFGLIRSREFIMKDAYSFHISQNSLQETYNLMYQTYNKIFNRIGLNFRSVKADTGTIGGTISHEFQVLANNGEDFIVFSNNSNYAANIELAKSMPPIYPRKKASEILKIINVNKIKTIDKLINFLSISIKKTIKIFFVHATKNSKYKFIALLIRGDHTLNKLKVAKLLQVSIPLTFATTKEIRTIIDIEPFFLGPINLKIPIIADYNVALMSDFIAGANIEGKYYVGINWKRDLPLPKIITDIRNVVEGDISPDGNGKLLIQKGIEVGHIFQLDTKYSKIMKVIIQEKNSHYKALKMGCYGIGITRLVSAFIEQNYDKYGIIWLDSIAPFQVAIIPINMHKFIYLKELAEYLYKKLNVNKITVLFDDRKEHTGIMFSDMELIGIPHCIIISNRNFKNKEVEYKNRRTGNKKIIKITEIIDFLLNKIKKKY